MLHDQLLERVDGLFQVRNVNVLVSLCRVGRAGRGEGSLEGREGVLDDEVLGLDSTSELLDLIPEIGDFLGAGVASK